MLDKEAQAFLDFTNSPWGVYPHMLSPGKNRFGERYLRKKAGKPPQPVAKVEDRLIPVEYGVISIRIYTPSGAGPFPVLVYFHGGGFVIGDLNSLDSPLRAITNSAAVKVVSVDYRLAPEHKFPAALNDCYLATKWVAENAASLHIDSKRIIIGGDSAGGNLAAAVTLISRDSGGPSLCYQILIYPVTDLSREYPSQRKFSGYFLTTDDLLYFKNHYLANHEDAKNHYVSPILADDLSGLPPALIVTAGYDPLHDEGEAYATRLRESGVEVDYHCYEGMIHGFLPFGGMMTKADSLIELIARTICP